MYTRTHTYTQNGKELNNISMYVCVVRTCEKSLKTFIYYKLSCGWAKEDHSVSYISACTYCQERNDYYYNAIRWLHCLHSWWFVRLLWQRWYCVMDSYVGPPFSLSLSWVNLSSNKLIAILIAVFIIFFWLLIKCECYVFEKTWENQSETHHLIPLFIAYKIRINIPLLLLLLSIIAF